MTQPKKPKKKPDTAHIKTGDGREIKVDAIATGVRVTWVCGATRDFTPEGLAFAITNLEQLAGYENSVPIWMDDYDHGRQRFSVRLADGRLHGDDHPSESAHHVSWAVLKKALLARAK